MNISRSVTAAAALLLSAGIATSVAPGANAAGNTTIYPNYSNSHCGPLGSVRAIQLAAFPGGTTGYALGNWAPLRANNGASTRIVANVWCNYPWSKSGSSFKVVERTVVARANTSYYF